MTKFISGMSRRQFGIALAAFSIGGGCGTVAHARGGGGDVPQQRAEERQRRSEKKSKEPLFLTQKKFVSLSRSKMFEFHMHKNAYVEGFSPEMSQHLFEMGIANLPRTKVVVMRLQAMRDISERAAALNKELEYARKDFEGFRGFASQRKKRKTYFEKIALWTKNPDEGLLRS